MQILLDILMYVLIAGALGCVLAIIIVAARPSGVSVDKLPPLMAIPLLDEREAALMADLGEVAQKSGLILFAKAPLSELLEAEKEDARQKWREALRAWQVDFLLCDAKTLKPALAILPVEPGMSQAQRSPVCTEALGSAGIPYILLGNYNLPGLEKAVREKLASSREKAAVKSAV